MAHRVPVSFSHLPRHCVSSLRLSRAATNLHETTTSAPSSSHFAVRIPFLNHTVYVSPLSHTANACFHVWCERSPLGSSFFTSKIHCRSLEFLKCFSWVFESYRSKSSFLSSSYRLSLKPFTVATSPNSYWKFKMTIKAQFGWRMLLWLVCEVEQNWSCF